MSKKRLAYWIFQILGWSGYAFVNITIVSIAEVSDPNNLIKYSFLLQALFFLGSTHLFRHFIIRWRWIKMSISAILYRVLVSVLILSMANYLFQITISYLLGLFTPEADLQLVAILTNLFLVFIFYFLWSAIYFLYNYMESYNANLKQEAAINEIRLNALKSQLNPHFIFNALNSVRALVDEEPSRAKMAITQLSNILRNSLVMDKKKVIAFKDEMQTVKDYLNLEFIRFEERLQTRFHIHPESNLFEVPPLMIQTLVENGIKHGISNLVEGGLIQIETDVRDGYLYISIKNSGQIHPNPGHSRRNKNSTGYGLANTRQRLDLIYGDKAAFSIKNLDEDFVLTEIRIPQRI